jgi:hypothetical protein
LLILCWRFTKIPFFSTKKWFNVKLGKCEPTWVQVRYLFCQFIRDVYKKRANLQQIKLSQRKNANEDIWSRTLHVLPTENMYIYQIVWSIINNAYVFQIPTYWKKIYTDWPASILYRRFVNHCHKVRDFIQPLFNKKNES